MFKPTRFQSVAYIPVDSTYNRSFQKQEVTVAYKKTCKLVGTGTLNTTALDQQELVNISNI